MNKLLVSNIINLDSGKYILDFKNDKGIINTKGIVTLYLINTKLKELTINLEDNSNLVVYKYDKLLSGNLDIIINENNNTEFNFNNAFTNEDNSSLKINNFIRGNNNESKINIRNISNNNYSKIEINVDVLKNTINNIALEDLRGINNGGFIQIEPNIKCGSNEVIANHLTTIGTIDKDSVSYLMSKGIYENTAKEILLKSFIYSNMDEYIKNLMGGD